MRNGRLDERLSQRSAKPSTPVRIGYRPHFKSKCIRNSDTFIFLVNNQSNSLKTTLELGISKKKHYLCIQVCKITYIIYYKHV